MRNFILFQLGWFACVLGASRDMPWIGVAVVGIIIVLHLKTTGRSSELALIGASAVMGAVVDTVLLQSGLVTYEGRTPPQSIAPAWIIAMWANFAITVRHSLAWLSAQWTLALLLGAAGGPLAYWGAASLGAVSLPSPVTAMVVLSIAWAAAVRALFWISSRLGAVPHTREGATHASV